MRNLLPFIILLLLSISTHAQPDEAGSYYRLYKNKDRETISKEFSEELRLYDLRNGMHVMDVGGSDGKMLLFLSLVCDSIDYYLEDINDINFFYAPKFLALAKTKINPRATSTLHTIKGGDSTIPVSLLFDRIIVRETFHHFDHPLQMIREFKRLLADDGRIVISEPASQKGFKHCHFLPPQKLIDLFTAEGLKLISNSVTDSGPLHFRVYVFSK